MNLEFKIQAAEGRARTGVLRMNGKTLPTPNFIYAATYGQVNLQQPTTFKKLGIGAVMVNTFQIRRSPLLWDQISSQGISKHMGLNGELTMSDSGGFQVLSYGDAREDGTGKIYAEKRVHDRDISKRRVSLDDDGATFQLDDGSTLRLTPEYSMEIQSQLGTDLIFAFDQCHSLKDRLTTQQIMERSHAWEERSLAAHNPQQALYGIVHGGQFRTLRRQSAEFVNTHDFDGVSIGGFMGTVKPGDVQPKAQMLRILDWTLPYLEPSLPRHLLGLGRIDDIFYGVERGIDTFDCVEITRLGRHDEFFTRQGTLPRYTHSLKLEHAQDHQPLDPWCASRGCPICSDATTYRDALLRLKHGPFVDEADRKAKKTAYRTALTAHNIHFISQLFSDIRQAITENSFSPLSHAWLGNHK